MSTLSSSSSSNLSAPRFIRCRRLEQEHYIDNDTDGFRFVLEAYESNLMPLEVFRFLQKTVNPKTGDVAGRWDGVCSSVDLAELPIGQAEVGQVPPSYRLAVVDVVLRSQAEANLTEQSIRADLAVLVKSLNLQDHLVLVDDFVIE